MHGEDEATHANEEATRRDPVGHNIGEGHAVKVVRTFSHEVAEYFGAIGILEYGCCDSWTSGGMSLCEKLADELTQRGGG